MNPAANPNHIAVSKSKGIQIDWADGLHSEYSLVYLRDHCPCATCTGAHGTPPRPKQGEDPFQMYTPAMKIEEVEPVGSYAIKIRWNDGHDAGIYTWEHLRSIHQK
jgi:DUF971 family protein